MAKAWRPRTIPQPKTPPVTPRAATPPMRSIISRRPTAFSSGIVGLGVRRAALEAMRAIGVITTSAAVTAKNHRRLLARPGKTRMAHDAIVQCAPKLRAANTDKKRMGPKTRIAMMGRVLFPNAGDDALNPSQIARAP